MALAIMVLPLILCACSINTGITRQQDAYLNFYTQLYRDQKSLLKGKTLAEVEPSFWQEVDTIPVTIFSNRVVSLGVGKIDTFSTVRDTVLYGGLNLISPSRLNDPVFQQKIDKIAESYAWQADGYFFQALKKSTTRPIEKKIAEGFLFGMPGQPASGKVDLGKRNAAILLVFHIMPNKMGGWGEPKYKLNANMGVIVATEQALRAFTDKFPGQIPVFSLWDMWSKKESGSELRRVNAFPGMYIGSIFKNSAYYTKDEWLAENGIFLEEQIKSTLGYLAQESGRLFFSAQ